MKLLTQAQGSMDCLLLSAAMVLEQDPEKLRRHILFESDRPDTELTGFTPNEIVEASLWNDTPLILLYPRITIDKSNRYLQWDLDMNKKVLWYLRHRDAIVMFNTHHACAFDHVTQMVYDPNGTVYQIPEAPELYSVMIRHN